LNKHDGILRTRKDWFLGQKQSSGFKP
jgi:hypothetical protein